MEKILEEREDGSQEAGRGENNFPLVEYSIRIIFATINRDLQLSFLSRFFSFRDNFSHYTIPSQLKKRS